MEDKNLLRVNTTRLPRAYYTARNQLKKYLVDKSIYQDIDEGLLNEYMFSLYMRDVAQESIITDGQTINRTKDPDKLPSYQPNPEVSNYTTALKNITTILTKLGLTPQERMKLKVQATPKPKKNSAGGFGS